MVSHKGTFGNSNNHVYLPSAAEFGEEEVNTGTPAMSDKIDINWVLLDPPAEHSVIPF